ncbi:MAG: Crp/Fnr family transcriptional regulator [Oscillatoria sp. PMC 1076.18]|nr:Crp/Fnr family transcriptional regulator [Oscillatoria sp. PMC 1076.18]
MSIKNHLLELLTEQMYDILAPNLQLVLLNRGQVLHIPNETITELYFPIDCLLSIIITMENGATAETGIVGNREVMGINALMGGRETTQTEYVVQIGGAAMKIDAKIMRQEFEKNKELRDVMLTYTQAFIAQISQNTACNRLHVIEKRLARWLLEVQDRINSDELILTQELISNMLGVRRSGVTQAAQKLQEEGIITYHRGYIQIIKQQKLEAASCECFRVVRDEYDRLLGRKIEEKNECSR